ncbi:MAG: hypothetical protein ACTHMM_04700 [Agriterribacter sp.]
MLKPISAIVIMLVVASTIVKSQPSGSPRIVNIVNFIRQLEPRDAAITEDVLLETVRSQINLFSRYNLPASYLLQYDALINLRYQQLLKEHLNPGSEIGAWWEITQPHVEAAGLKWRGRYPWDWHANVGFSTGYTPAEREKLVDVYMEKFKSVFGRYPEAVASWFIDEHTLAYLYDKYHIVASANCKDQVGTDGYTLWGGYWNQAYYPSRQNAYMPAQNAPSQIGVPVFRMLGSDPIYQYDSGLGGEMSGVISLEPVYKGGGGDSSWVRWFMRSIAEEPCLSFAYTQAGQENSFTWQAMKKGLELQAPLFDSLRNAGKIKVETLSASGKWFSSQYTVTPATAVTALTDYRNEGNKTAWYNSRFYRVNLLWKGNSFRFRDIHLFDERVVSPYLKAPGTSTQCIYKTLPVLDGFAWSDTNHLAGIRILQQQTGGTMKEVSCKNIEVRELAGNVLEATWQTDGAASFRILFYEDRFEVSSSGNQKWLMEYTVAPGKSLPFTEIGKQTIKARFNNFDYRLRCSSGTFKKGKTNTSVFTIVPNANRIVVETGERGER